MGTSLMLHLGVHRMRDDWLPVVSESYARKKLEEFP